MENKIFLDRLGELEALIKMQGIHQKDYLTIKEAAYYLQLSVSCLYKMKDKGELVYYKPGGKIIYLKKSDLDKWIDEGRVASLEEEGKIVEKYLSRTNKSIRA